MVENRPLSIFPYANEINCVCVLGWTFQVRLVIRGETEIRLTDFNSLLRRLWEMGYKNNICIIIVFMTWFSLSVNNDKSPQALPSNHPRVYRWHLQNTPRFDVHSFCLKNTRSFCCEHFGGIILRSISISNSRANKSTWCVWARGRRREPISV